MTSTFWRRNSEAISLTRLELLSVQRYSIAAVSPSIQPSSCRRATKAAAHGFHIVAFDPRTPMRRGLLTCWAYAAIGHAPIRPQTTLMNSRRFMSVSLLPEGYSRRLKQYQIADWSLFPTSHQKEASMSALCQKRTHAPQQKT